MNPEISIIVPVYNVEKYLKRCIDSILNQSFTDFELILVDDGSTDNSGKIIDEYALKDKRIKVIHKENGGQGSARNRGLDIAKGNYIGFVDSDDWIHKDMYKCMYQIINEDNTDIVQVGHNTVEEYTEDKRGNINDLNIICIDNIIEKLADCNSFEILPLIFPVNKLYKRRLWNNLRFPEGKFAEDLRIIYKIYEITNNYKIIDFNFYNYYMSPNSSTRGEFNIKKLEDLEAWNEMLIYFKKNFKHINLINLKSIYCRRLKNYYMELYIRNKYKDISKKIKKEFLRNSYSFIITNKLNIKEKISYLIFLLSPLCYKHIFIRMN